MRAYFIRSLERGKTQNHRAPAPRKPQTHKPKVTYFSPFLLHARIRLKGQVHGRCAFMYIYMYNVCTILDPFEDHHTPPWCVLIDKALSMCVLHSQAWSYAPFSSSIFPSFTSSVLLAPILLLDVSSI